MQASRLRHLYIGELRDLYHAEKQVLKALPAIAGASISEELRTRFREYLNQTEEHLARLKEVFTILGETPKGQKCRAMKALIKQAAEVIEMNPAPEELDAGLISAAQRVEHYQIAGYGCACAYARLLGDDRAVSLLKKTLQEEKEADRKLTALSRRMTVTPDVIGPTTAVSSPSGALT